MTTGSTLETHWLPTIISPVAFQCTLGSMFQAHWMTTGSTLETHCQPTIISPVAFQCTLGSMFQAHWIATGLLLNYHWLRVRGVSCKLDNSQRFVKAGAMDPQSPKHSDQSGGSKLCKTPWVLWDYIDSYTNIDIVHTSNTGFARFHWMSSVILNDIIRCIMVICDC